MSRKFIVNSKWTFASTMPKNPHEYTVRNESYSEDEFEGFIRHIRKNGFQEKYGRRWYTCLIIGEWKYWTMGYPVWETTIINRCKV